MAKAALGSAAKRPQMKSDPRETNAKRITDVIEQVEKQLSKSEFKATVADYIRLLQLQKEYAKETPRDIEVTWVESQNENERNAA